jgi:CRISPR-associated protein Cas4
MDDGLLPISALQHFAYCPRQFALIHIEQAWEENQFTAEGRHLHERVDGGFPEQRGSVRYERSVMVCSDRLGIQGKLDLLEVHQDGSGARYLPVEYKRGKPKLQDWDRIQLCAQALCLEEMVGVQLNEGALWYWQVRKREPVVLNEVLRESTLKIIEEAQALRVSGCTPRPTDIKQRCRGCSLVDVCQPERFRRDRSSSYVAGIFEDEETS